MGHFLMPRQMYIGLFHISVNQSLHVSKLKTLWPRYKQVKVPHKPLKEKSSACRCDKNNWVLFKPLSFYEVELVDFGGLESF